MSDEAELSDVQHRLDDLEDRLGMEYPTPDTSVGGAQRLRLESPTPWSVLTIGARGIAASEGQAVGPGGFGLSTEEHLGAQIRGNTCLDSDGWTIVHSVEATRVLTQADLGLAASEAVRVGTTEGDVEVTAGSVPVNDPSFTVVPSMLVPVAPEVDTASPRAAVEAEQASFTSVWTALGVASSLKTSFELARAIDLTSAVAAGTLGAQVRAILGAVRAAMTVKRASQAAGLGVAAAYDLDQLFSSPSKDPKVKVHGAGGVALTSPSEVTAFAPKVGISARETVGVASAFKTSVMSAGYTDLYGGAAVSVASEGPAELKSTVSVASLVGKYAEVVAADTASVRSNGHLMISGKTDVSLESAKVAISGGEYVGASSGDMVQLEAPFVHTSAREQNTVSSAKKVVVKGDETVEIECGGSKMTLKDGELRINHGGGMSFVIDRSSVQLPRAGFRVERSRTRIRGPVDLG